MSELQERLNALSERGTPRGVDAVFDEATRTAATIDEADVGVDELDPIPFVTEEPVRRRRRPMSSLIAATGTLTLLLVSMMAVAAFLGNGGANSPEGAVRKLADAISHEDPLAAADVLAPSEVRSLHGTLDAAAKRAAELALVQQAGAPLSGLDFNVDDLTMTTEQLGPDHAKVRIQGGAIRARTEHEKFSPLVQRSLGDPSTNEASVDLAEGWDDDNELFVVAVREDGDWYISAAYTTLEYIRVASDLPAAEFGSGVNNVAALGADTPDAAAEAGMRALGASDWAAVISLADPKELPLYDYRAALLELATREEVKSDFTITNVSTDSQVSGDKALVRITATGKTGGNENWSVDGGCLTTPVDSYVGDTVERVDTDWCVGGTFGSIYTFGMFYSGDADPSGVSELTVVRRDGRWFLSPVGTVLDVLDTWIANMDQRSLYLLLQQPEQLPPDGTLTLNQPVQLPAQGGYERVAMYEFDGKAGQEVLAEVAPNPRPEECCGHNVVILNPDGSYVEDGAMPLYGNPLRLPADARYRVLVTTYGLQAESLTLWNASEAPGRVRAKTGQTCSWEGDGGTSCSTSEPGTTTETSNGSLGVGDGETCIETSDGSFECSASSASGEAVPASTAPTSIP